MLKINFHIQRQNLLLGLRLVPQQSAALGTSTQITYSAGKGKPLQSDIFRPCPNFYSELRSNYLQNHRMVGVGKDLHGSSSPTSLPKQGHLQQAAQDLIQAGLEYLQR